MLYSLVTICSSLKSAERLLFHLRCHSVPLQLITGTLFGVRGVYRMSTLAARLWELGRLLLRAKHLQYRYRRSTSTGTCCRLESKLPSRLM